MLDSILNIDFSILDFIQTHLKCVLFDWLMPRISALGNGGAIWIVTAIFMMCKKKYRKQGVVLAVGLLACLMVGNVILKPLIARQRPNWINSGIALLIKNPQDFSFPSGHTLSSFVSAFLIFMNNKKVGFYALLLAIAIAFSRLYLYVHYPSDILGAILLAFVISLSVHKIFYKSKDKDTKKRGKL